MQPTWADRHGKRTAGVPPAPTTTRQAKCSNPARTTRPQDAS